MPKKTPWIFLDRDGTLIRDQHYLSRPDQVELIPEAIAALKEWHHLHEARFIVVTNQSGVGRGYFSEDTIPLVHKRLDQLLSEENLVIEHYYYCPHSPEAHCSCRKPEINLGLEAIERYGIDPAMAAMIGDKQSDLDFGRKLNFGAQFLVSREGQGWEQVQPWWDSRVC